jgi:hypothetical protein
MAAPFDGSLRGLPANEDVTRRSAAQTCSTATTPGADLSAPAIAALTE